MDRKTQSVIAEPVSGGAEFLEYIQERETPYVALPKEKDEISTAFNRETVDQDRVKHSRVSATGFSSEDRGQPELPIGPLPKPCLR